MKIENANLLDALTYASLPHDELVRELASQCWRPYGDAKFQRCGISRGKVVFLVHKTCLGLSKLEFRDLVNEVLAESKKVWEEIVRDQAAKVLWELREWLGQAGCLAPELVSRKDIKEMILSNHVPRGFRLQVFQECCRKLGLCAKTRGVKLA